jgi:hypothetical protein
MKGWRPSACPEARNRFGLFSGGRILAGHRIDQPVLVPTCPRALAGGRQGSPSSHNEAARPPRRTYPRPKTSTMKRRPPFTSLKKAGGTRNEDQRNTNPTRTGSADAMASFEAGSGAETKTGLGGRCNALIRLDSAKEIQGFCLTLFGRALLDEARIWLNLGLAWKSLGLN